MNHVPPESLPAVSTRDIAGLVAVPLHNEALNLPAVIADLRRAVPASHLLFVDDASSDRSRHVLQSAGVPFLSHPVHLGYHEALRTAIRYAMTRPHRFIAFFDADGQHRADDLLNLIRLHEKDGADLIVGSRFLAAQDRTRSCRHAATRLFSAIASRAARVPVTDATSGLKLISRPFLPVALHLPAEDLHAELIVGLVRQGPRFAEVPVANLPRLSGASMYGFLKAGLYPLKSLLCLAAVLFFLKRVSPTHTGDSP